MTTTIRDRELFRKASHFNCCKICGEALVVYDWSIWKVEMLTAEIANPDVCHVNLGNQVASFWCPKMRH